MNRSPSGKFRGGGWHSVWRVWIIIGGCLLIAVLEVSLGAVWHSVWRVWIVIGACLLIAVLQVSLGAVWYSVWRVWIVIGGCLLIAVLQVSLGAVWHSVWCVWIVIAGCLLLARPNTIKGLCRFIEQETWLSVLSDGWFQERIRAWFHYRTKINQHELTLRALRQ